MDLSSHTHIYYIHITKEKYICTHYSEHVHIIPLFLNTYKASHMHKLKSAILFYGGATYDKNNNIP